MAPAAGAGWLRSHVLRYPGGARPPDGLVAAMLWDCADGAPPELLAALPPH